MKRLLILIVVGLAFSCFLVAAVASARAEASGAVESAASAEPAASVPAASSGVARSTPRKTPADSTRAEAARHVPARERLDDIRIEGELTAPEVLFITGRDRARFRDPLHWRTVSSVEELERTIVPLRELCFPHPGF